RRLAGGGEKGGGKTGPNPTDRGKPARSALWWSIDMASRSPSSSPPRTSTRRRSLPNSSTPSRRSAAASAHRAGGPTSSTATSLPLAEEPTCPRHPPERAFLTSIHDFGDAERAQLR